MAFIEFKNVSKIYKMGEVEIKALYMKIGSSGSDADELRRDIKELKDEREVLSKYGYNTDELDEKLSSYGLTEEELEAI